MKKNISTFVCQECGYESTSWLGKCPECGAWNSLKEILSIGRSVSGRQISNKKIDLIPKTLDEISYTEKDRITTGFSEMDGVLGGGIVKGSVILLAGDPGIGKSTLLLQVGLNIASFAAPCLVLYISGEESEEQIKIRAKRISKKGEDHSFLLLSATNTDLIVAVLEKLKPSLVIIDSIQTMESESTSGLSGSVAQVRFAAFSFIRVAKTLNIPIILVGHVTKEGMVAGPMVLSHMVDTVLFLEGEKLTKTRILRSLKNRFGPVDEVGVFTMEGEGITEVKNPEQIFLAGKKDNTPGSLFAAILEGTRPFLIELQALVVFSKLPYPRRVASGIDSRRLELLLAVLQKQCRLPVDTMDVFVNVAGGLKIVDPAADLGICLAIFSSLKNVSIPKTVGIAEIGLLGELRAVPSLEKRIKEAKKLGFDKIVSSNTHNYLNEVLNSLEKLEVKK